MTCCFIFLRVLRFCRFYSYALHSTLVRSLPACPCFRSSVLGRIKSVMSEGSLGSLAVHAIEEPALFFFQFSSQYSYMVAIWSLKAWLPLLFLIMCAWIWPSLAGLVSHLPSVLLYGTDFRPAYLHFWHFKIQNLSPHRKDSLPTVHCANWSSCGHFQFKYSELSILRSSSFY